MVREHILEMPLQFFLPPDVMVENQEEVRELSTILNKLESSKNELETEILLAANELITLEDEISKMNYKMRFGSSEDIEGDSFSYLGLLSGVKTFFEFDESPTKLRMGLTSIIYNSGISLSSVTTRSLASPIWATTIYQSKSGARVSAIDTSDSSRATLIGTLGREVTLLDAGFNIAWEAVLKYPIWSVAFSKDKDFELYLGTLGTVLKYDIRMPELPVSELLISEIKTPVYSVCPTNQGICAATSEGLFLSEGTSEKFEKQIIEEEACVQVISTNEGDGIAVAVGLSNESEIRIFSGPSFKENQLNYSVLPRRIFDEFSIGNNGSILSVGDSRIEAITWNSKNQIRLRDFPVEVKPGEDLKSVVSGYSNGVDVITVISREKVRIFSLEN